MLDTFRQFINYRLEQRPAPQKPDKIPVDALTGKAINPHDTRNHLTFAEAYRRAVDHRLGIGFDLGPFDGLGCVDLDGCRNPQTSELTAEAQAVLARFPGAFCEVSVSQTGLHLWLRCNKALFEDRARKFNGVEFYTVGRFIALGNPMSGDFSRDWTAELLDFVPLRTTSPGLTQHPVAPTMTVDEVMARVEKMKASKDSANAAFGKNAHPRDLWNGDSHAVAKYPSPSEADAALMWHIAYWFEKHPGNMELAFGLSELGKRPKWLERPKYRADTIANAIATQPGVYQSRALPTPTDATASFSGTTLSPNEQTEYFRGCVYVRSAHRVFDAESGQLYKPEVFNAMKGGKRFMIDWSAPRNETDDAFTALTKNRAVQFPQAFATVFRPNLAAGAIIHDEHGRALVNIYKPPAIERIQGDVTPFLNHVAKLLPDDRDRMILMSWMARCVQRPGEKVMWSPVIVSTEGAGKNVLKYVLRHAVGRSYAYSPNAQELKASGAKFNAWAESKVVVFVDEIKTDERRDLLEILKPLISEDEIEIQGKGVDQRMGDSVANWIFCTNHPDAVPITTDSRRYSTFFSPLAHAEDLQAAGMDDAYFKWIFGWLKNGGCAIVAEFLHTMAIPPEFETMRAPKTTSTQEAIQKSYTNNQQIVVDAIEDGEVGFRGNWASSSRILNKLEAAGVKPLPVTNTISKMMADLGYRLVGRSTVPIFEENLSKPRLYFKGQISPEGRTEAYRQAQGYR